MNTKKMAILTVTPEAFRGLLQLPESVEVVGVEVAQGYRGVLRIVIEGAGWDTREGEAISPTGAATITNRHDETGAIVSRSIDWHLPKDD